MSLKQGNALVQCPPDGLHGSVLRGLLVALQRVARLAARFVQQAQVYLKWKTSIAKSEYLLLQLQKKNISGFPVVRASLGLSYAWVRHHQERSHPRWAAALMSVWP